MALFAVFSQCHISSACVYNASHCYPTILDLHAGRAVTELERLSILRIILPQVHIVCMNRSSNLSNMEDT